MSYSIKQVSEMSGVSVRALRLYDQMGLVCPARQENGYRTYESADLDVLQQVLLYRSCGMELSKIAQILQDPGFSRKEALVEHLEILEAQRRRLDETMAMLRRTIDALEGGEMMMDEEKFEGLKRVAIEDNEKKYGAEARDRWGDEAVDAANQQIDNLSKESWNRKDELEQRVIAILKRAVDDGELDAKIARELVSAHAEWIRMHWGEGRYSTEAHKSLAEMYGKDHRFADYYDSRAGVGATEILARAIAENA